MTRYRHFAVAANGVLCLIWVGMLFGVGLIASPARFMPATMSTAQIFDYGRFLFGLMNQVELLLGIAVIALTLIGPRRFWRDAITACIVAMVAIQTFFLMPELDARSQAVVAGQSLDASPVHTLNFAAEGVKVAGLLALGIALAGRGIRRSETRSGIG